MLSENTCPDFRVEISNYNSWPNFSNLHTHTSYELYFLLQGSTYFLIENSTVEIHEGDIVWIPPGTLHITRPRDTERHRKVGLYISESFLQDCLHDDPDMKEFVSKCRILCPTDSNKSYFRRLLNMLIEEYLGEHPYIRNAIRGLLTATITQMLRIYDNSHCDKKNITLQMKTPRELKILISYINSNFKNDISLSNLAAQVNMSPVYISSLFKKHLGFTFKEYLLDLRIKTAMQMLKETTNSVENIAYACGFNSSNHFCKTFKKMVNMPPKMFRETNSEKF